MDHSAGWKDTAFTWAMGGLILQRIADGETIKAITADPRMPAYCTVYQWMRVVPAFGDAVRELRAAMAEEKLAWRDAQAKLRPKRRSGRRSTYSEEVAAELCARIAEGASLSEVVRQPGMPSFKAVYRWLRDRPEFRANYVEACDWRAGWLEFQAECVVWDSTPFTFQHDKAEVARLAGRRGRLTPRLYRKLRGP